MLFMKKIKIPLFVFIVAIALFVAFKIFISSGNGVGIDVQYAGLAGGCSDEKPIHVTIKNRLPFNLNSYSFELWATRNGYSKVVRQDLRPREYDKIIPAFGTDDLCWYSSQTDEVDAYMNSPKYGSVDAARKAIIEENPSLQWAGEIKSAYWDFGISYR